MYYNIRILIDKTHPLVPVKKGQIRKAYVHPNGRAFLIEHYGVPFKIDEYELYIPDSEFNKLLKG